jgi:hypothetical protein
MLRESKKECRGFGGANPLRNNIKELHKSMGSLRS